MAGTKPFFMGDKPTEVDCSMFGMIAQMVWNMPESPFEQLLEGKMTTCLNRYHLMIFTLFNYRRVGQFKTICLPDERKILA